MTSRPLDQLDSREAMLETLKLAYQFVLDQDPARQSAEWLGGSRLSGDEERELGRRLAAYWRLDKPSASRDPFTP